MSAPLEWPPEIALVPDQLPEAVQEVALVDDQVSVDDSPLVVDVGFATSETVGTGSGAAPPWPLSALLPPPPLQAATISGTISVAIKRMLR